MTTLRTFPTSLFLALGLTACGGIEPYEPEEVVAPDEDTQAPFSSELATLMMFEFNGELLSPSSLNATGYVEDQLLYTIGQLNGSRSVGRLDALELSSVTTTREGTMYRVRYHARLPVAWGSKTNLPTAYTLIL